MLGELASLIFLIVLLNKFYHFVFDKPTANVPPGLPRLPIWGSYWFLIWGSYDFPHLTIKYYTEKYKSKVISCYLGDYFTVIATNYESVKELLRNKNFDGRLADAYLFKARAFGKKLGIKVVDDGTLVWCAEWYIFIQRIKLHGGTVGDYNGIRDNEVIKNKKNKDRTASGIFFTDGPSWKEQRRFALRHMRDFGFGRRMDKVESEFAEELNILLDTIKNGPINDDERNVMKDGKVLFPDILYPFAANFFLSIFTGERAPRTEHKKLRKVSKAASLFQRNSDTTGGAILPTPWLRHFAHGFTFPGFIEGAAGITSFIKNCVKTYKSSFIDEAERGFLDTYIKKLKDNNELSTFSEEQLLMLGTDFIFPALTANPWGVTVFIKYMMHYPNIMEKVQKEIDTVVGRDRLITLNDRVNLPYTDATTREIMRADTMTPWSVAHRAMEDDKLCGFDIPANTVLVTDLHSMHHDPEFWGDPENIRPERFLTEDGQLGKDHSLPFGAGGRLCAGETFARQYLFLTFGTLAQNFNFSFVDGEPSSLQDKLPGFATSPKDFWIGVVPRK